MQIAPLIVLLVVVAYLSVILDRRYRVQQQPSEDNPDGTPAEEQDPLAPLSDSVNRLISTVKLGPKSWYDSTARRNATALPQQFQTWLTDTSTVNQKVKTWVGEFSPESLQAFTDHVAAFCSDMGFELSWVVDQQLVQQNPSLAKALEQVVLDYCQACQKAAEVQEELDVQQALSAFERNPSSRKSQAFGQKLYASLVDEGLVSASMSKFLTASKAEKQEHVTTAIQEAVAKDRGAFQRILKDVVVGLPEASIADQAADAAPSASPSTDHNQTAQTSSPA